MTAPALDPLTAAEVTALLAADALTGASVTHGGDAYEVTRVNILRGMNQHPWGLSLTISDDTRGECINVSLALAAQPVGGAR